MAPSGGGGAAAPARRAFLLWTAVEQRKAREMEAWRAGTGASIGADGPYADLLARALAAVSTEAALAATDAEITKDLKRTFPWLASYAEREAATRRVLLAFATRNPSIGYCQSLNYIVAALLLIPVEEADAFYALCTLVEELMPADYYSAATGILGARVDQLTFTSVLRVRMPELARHLAALDCPISLFTIGWFMPLYAKDLPLAVALRVWDVLFVYGDTTLFAVGLALLKMAEPRLLACATLEQLYEVLKTIGGAMHERDSEAAQRLLLLVMEGLMCSPLADFIATERERHRANLCRDAALAAADAGASGDAHSDANGDDGDDHADCGGGDHGAGDADAALVPPSVAPGDGAPAADGARVQQHSAEPAAGGAELAALIGYLRRRTDGLRESRAALLERNTDLRARLSASGHALPPPLPPLPAARADTPSAGDETPSAGADAPSTDSAARAPRGGARVIAGPRVGAPPPPPPLPLSPSPLHWYDAVLDVVAFSDVLRGGWALRFAPSLRHTRAGTPAPPPASAASATADDVWSPIGVDAVGEPSDAVVGVLGQYNTGKTFLLNMLTGLSLPSSKRVATRGLSLRRAAGLAGTMPLMLVDSEGTLAPAPLEPAHALLEKHATEELLEHLTVSVSDYVLYVVEGFSSVDQRAVHRHAQYIGSSSKRFRELIVVHNLRTVADDGSLWHRWRTQVTELYGRGAECTSSVHVAAAGADGGAQLEAREARWLQTSTARHLVLANHASPFGEAHNRATAALLRQWVQSSVHVAGSRAPILRQLIDKAERAIAERLGRHVALSVESTADPTVRYVRASVDPNDGARAPSAAPAGAPAPRADAASPSASGSRLADAAPHAPTTRLSASDRTPPQLARALSPLLPTALTDECWVPRVDLCAADAAYVALIDLPGLRAPDLRMWRTGSTTHVCGRRSVPYRAEAAGAGYAAAAEVLRAERRYGRFRLALEIPERYHSKWAACAVAEGVLTVRWLRDIDEEDLSPS